MLGQRDKVGQLTPMGAAVIKGGVTFRTWAPNARDVFLMRDPAILEAPPAGWAPDPADRLIPLGDGTWAGFAAGITALVLLSMSGPVRTPVCRRPIWRMTRTTLRALASHEMFAAMADSAGPFGPVARYRRTGCTDEFWFTALTGQGGQAVVFRVHRTAPGTRLAVHTSLLDPRTPGTSWPARTISVADVLTGRPHRAGDSDYRRSQKRLAPTTAGWTPAAQTSGVGPYAADCGAPSSQAGRPRTNAGRRYEVSPSP